MLASRSLDALLRRAGAVMVQRAGIAIPAHFGSPAGELAVCTSAVGLADRSDLVKLRAAAGAPRLDALLELACGRALGVGEVRGTAGIWWCRTSPRGVLALCELPQRARALEALAGAGPVPVQDVSADLAALALLGPATTRLLAALGEDAGDRATLVPSIGVVSLGGVGALLLRESSREAIVVTEQARAGQLWLATERAGARLGLSCVGLEAMQRFELVERRAGAASGEAAAGHAQVA